MENPRQNTAKSPAPLVTIAAALVVSACLQATPTKVGPQPEEASNGTPSAGPSSSPAVDAFRSAKSVKVVFNKSNFYNNHGTNSFGCAGDARNYFDPFTDRVVPVRPNWIKNVSVELTNSNAGGGASEAAACGLTGLGAPVARNCASFDDLQPLQGDAARAVLVGGFGCTENSAACARNRAINDVWSLSVPEDTADATWSKESGALPAVSTSSGATSGLAWHGGDYDEIHDQFYLYGGAAPDTTSPSGAQIYSDKVMRLAFGSDRTLSTSDPPITLSASTRANYAGWSTVGSSVVTQLNAKGIGVPPAMVGNTFTYGLRRDPSMKSHCQEGSAGCLTSKFSTTDLSAAVALNEHEDYYLLLGGMPSSGSAQNDFQAGIFSRQIYLFKPHGLSNDVGTNGSTASLHGDWSLVSNLKDTGAGLLSDVSTNIMSVVEIGYDSSSDDEPFVPVRVGEFTPDGDDFDGWMGRAYHRATYDPHMNRFYVFGGLQNAGVTDAATSGISALSSGGSAPELTDTAVWAYDPPALGRRPTAACFTASTPDAKSLPIGGTGSTDGKILGTNINLGPNRGYAAAPFVFPPGGCLQRIDGPESAKPDARFEHAQAFDRDRRALMVFGGCTETSTIDGPGNSSAGNPLTNCNRLSLLNDAWFWLPPTRLEFVSKDYRTTATSPYNASTLLANVFTIDFWIDFMAMFIGGNDPGSDSIAAPRPDEVMGKWIKLTPTGSVPSKRASASFYYDRSHRKFYLQGGYGCVDSACSSPQVLNDLWEFTPPNAATECDREAGLCSSQGNWTLIRANDDSDSGQPSLRMGAIAAFAESQVSYGDEYYTVTDAACLNQGPLASTDSSISKQFVGAIYLDVDRSSLSSGENLLINLRLLPYSSQTRAPAFNDNNTPLTGADDGDLSSTNDQAVIRVQLLKNPLKLADQIQSLIQPRYHEFISGAPIIADTFMYVAGATGQITEKQILVPLSLDPEVNLVKIERVTGSVKFYEMSVSKF